MPQIIVATDHGAAFGDGAVTFRERVTVADFESEHFANQLVERLGWAVEDADQVEQIPGESGDSDQPERMTGRSEDGEPERIPGAYANADQADRRGQEPVGVNAPG